MLIKEIIYISFLGNLSNKTKQYTIKAKQNIKIGFTSLPKQSKTKQNIK
jgi:hypothetical protein